MDKAKSNFSMVMPLDVKMKLRQMARERHMSMSNMVVQLILDAPVEHPEEIGQVTMDDITKGS